MGFERRITLDYPPSANRYWRVTRHGIYVSNEAREYKAKVRLVAGLAGIRPMLGPLILQLDVYRPRKSGDLSNRIKVLEDALNGVAYEDDSQIVEIHARRFDSKENPRVEVSIKAAP